MAYCTRADIETRFGAKNVEQWADVDNDRDSDAIADRITAAIAKATSDIDDELRGGAVDVPFGASVPSAIVDCAVVLAAVWLYSARGYEQADEEEPAGRLAGAREDAARKLGRIRSGLMRLSGAQVVPNQAPAAFVNSTLSADCEIPPLLETPTRHKFPDDSFSG